MNLFSLAKMFPTEDAAVEYWIATRWPSGVWCVRCDHETVYRIATVGKTGKPSIVFECGKCRLHFSPTAGTLFHDSHLPLQKWFAAILACPMLCTSEIVSVAQECIYARCGSSRPANYCVKVNQAMLNRCPSLSPSAPCATRNMSCTPCGVPVRLPVKTE
jgi:Transposase zinc-ribbon domain